MEPAPLDREYLLGTWTLVSACSITAKGERDETPYGGNPTGFLTYSEDGTVTALISYGGRKPLSVAASPEEQAEAFRTFLAYAGSYKVAGDKVSHWIAISSIQNYVGRELVRNARLDGNRLILTTPPTAVNGRLQTVELIWERLEPKT